MSGGAPRGVVVLVTAPDGRVVASVSDFGGSEPGGYTRQAAQTYRAREAVAGLVMEVSCSEAVATALRAVPGGCWRVLDHMQRHQGYRVQVVPVGYDDAGAEARP